MFHCTDQGFAALWIQLILKVNIFSESSPNIWFEVFSKQVCLSCSRVFPLFPIALQQIFTLQTASPLTRVSRPQGYPATNRKANRIETFSFLPFKTEYLVDVELSRTCCHLFCCAMKCTKTHNN